MKTKLYLYGCVLSVAVLLSPSSDVFAQCNCAPNVAATEVSYWASLWPNPTTASKSDLFFPKFDPAVGQLTCISIRGVITSISQSTVTYTSPIGATRFRGSLPLTPRLSGPGLDIDRDFTIPYGPDSLLSQHWIDSIGSGSSTKVYGPDTVFKNEVLTSAITTNFNAYTTNLGTMVKLEYELNGSVNVQGGGSNFDLSVVTVSHGAFNLKYYWCPHAPLSNSIKNFKAALNDNIVNLTWQAQNQSGNTFQLQVSTDGQVYTTVYVQPSSVVETSGGNFKYAYNVSQSGSSTLYFRIQQTSATGKVSYTAISKVNRELVNSTEMGIYPNPVTDKISLKFEKEVNGDLSVDVVSLTGQVVFNKIIKLANAKSAQIDLRTPPSKGMYYIRATNQRSGIIYVNKLFVQ